MATINPAGVPRPLEQQLRRTLPRGRLRVARPGGCRDIALYLFDPSVMEGPLSHEEAQAVVATPAYWSFCWASGQVLAQWLLDHPQWVAGRRVLDFGAGSGVVAIAAALAGACSVMACDLDPAARLATEANAALNGVRLEVIEDWRDGGEVDLLLAADVLYDPENRPLLGQFRARAREVLLADSRLSTLGDDHYRSLTRIEARTWPDLQEFEAFNQVRLYHAGGGDSGGIKKGGLR
ncbi:MAG: 50S ribosomal protein L11 methyltransferase [Oleiphilaceae bacterium]|nr:50S ribosomal protein L11 methyltransferase [Oleiphilaceae bacterium]